LYLKATEFGEKRQKRPLRRSRSFKDINFGANQNPACSYLNEQ